MIKKLIGIIGAVAVVVIVVVAAIRRDNFRSMVLRDEAMDQVVPAPQSEPMPQEVIVTDTITDSVTIVKADSVVLPAQ